jgi:hypothetical protein
VGPGGILGQSGLGHDRCERGLADLKRIAPQIVAVQFDQVEGIEEDALVSAVVPDEIERGNAVVIAGDSFAILATLRGPAARAPRAATQPPRRR